MLFIFGYLCLLLQACWTSSVFATDTADLYFYGWFCFLMWWHFRRDLKLAFIFSLLERYWLKQTEPWHAIRLPSEEAKNALSKPTSCSLFVEGKLCKLADAESEHQQILLPLSSLAKWKVTKPNSSLLLWLAERMVCSLVSHAENPPKSCVSDDLTCSVLTEVRRPTAWEETEPREVFVPPEPRRSHCFYSFSVLQRMGSKMRENTAALKILM